MLTGLSIRDIVLIDRLDIDFSEGLCVLTGETGAGKSIILDALSLALGARADRSVVRIGKEKGSVAAIFDLPPQFTDDEAFDGLEIDPGEQLFLRRVITRDGKSRAFINDTPVAVSTLSRIGKSLLEIHGQHGDRQLMEPSVHRGLLDRFGGLETLALEVVEAFDVMQSAVRDLAEHESAIERLEAEKDYLEHAHEELQALGPRPDEEQELADRRSFMMQAESVHAEVLEAQKKLSDDNGIGRELYRVIRHLGGVKIEGTDRLERALGFLEQASVSLAEGTELVDALLRDLEFDPKELDETEERLFALRAAARKHKVAVDSLPGLLEKICRQIESLDQDQGRLSELRRNVVETQNRFKKVADKLSKGRVAAAKKLDRAITKELPPLKLQKARFETKIFHDSNNGFSRHGLETVEFHAATNPNTELGPLAKIASGGELARFALALKVVLQKSTERKTLIFDEVDQGIGGAVADAVGERLQKLAEGGQVLVITHSPQVAARANHHWRIRKHGVSKSADEVLTKVEGLDDRERREEIARMLAGAKVTDEARAAADQLLRHR